MITPFNSESIYLGTDMKRFNAIRHYLDANRIRYKYKVKNRSAQWAQRGTVRSHMGSAGSQSQSMYEYEIFVHKKDAARIQLPR